MSIEEMNGIAVEWIMENFPFSVLIGIVYTIIWPIIGFLILGSKLLDKLLEDIR